MIFSRKRDEYWQGVLDKEREYWQGVVRELTNQITLLKVEPQMAAIQAVPAEEATVSPYVSAFDDDALAEYELERRRLAADTAEFITQHDMAVAE